MIKSRVSGYLYSIAACGCFFCKKSNTFKSIAMTVNTVDEAMKEALALSEKAFEQEQRMIHDSEETAQRIVQEFNEVTSAMQTSMEKMLAERKTVNSDLEQVLVGLQRKPKFTARSAQADCTVRKFVYLLFITCVADGL